MSDRTFETSPQFYARIGGVLYLVLILVGMFAVIFVRGKLVIPGDATVTAYNILMSPTLWRVGIVADLFTHVLDVPIMLIIYLLLRPTNKNLALLALLFTAVQTAVLVANEFNLLMPLFLSGNAEYLMSFDPQKLNALSYVALKLYDNGFGIGLVFFGFACLAEGYLIFKSGYLPRTIGVLMAIAGVCYLTQSFALLLVPQVANALFPAIMLPCFVAELSFCLWLIARGVDVPQWQRRAIALRTG